MTNTHTDGTPSFSIDHEIPLPAPNTRAKRAAGAGRPSKYPFADMKPGQSFAVSADLIKAVRGSAAAYRAKHKSSFAYKIGVDPKNAEGFRIWATEVKLATAGEPDSVAPVTEAEAEMDEAA